MAGRPWILKQLEPFIHIQLVPMNEVIITHSKGKLNPAITLINTESNTPFEALVYSLDMERVVVKINKAVRFTAYIY